MIDRDHDLPITRQAKALGVARSSVYYAPRPVSAEDLDMMRRLNELHLDHPFAGARMLRDHGMEPTRRYWHNEPGFNYRLTNLDSSGLATAAGIGTIQAKALSISANGTGTKCPPCSEIIALDPPPIRYFAAQ